MKKIFVLGAALLALLPLPGFAADPAASDEAVDSLPQVIVTATRAAEPADATGSSVTVVGRREIEERQYQTVAQALQQVPGIALAANGTPGQTVGIFTRGMNTNQTLVMVNGHRLPQGLDGAFDLTNLTLDNVERIEVVRGPLSSVQGGNAGGGVINIITRDGRGLAKPEYTATFESGSFNTFREAVTAVGAQGPFDYSVGASLLDTSWQRLNNDYQRGNVDATFGYQINKEIRLSVDAFYHSAYTQDPGSLSLPSNTNWELHEAASVNPVLEWKTTENWTQTFSYLHNAERLPVSSGYSTGVWNDTSTRSQVSADQVNYDTSYRVADNLTLIGGFEFRDQNIWYYDNPTGVRAYDNNDTNTAGSIGLDYEPLQGWHIVPSIRIDHFSDYGSDVNWRVASSYRVAATRTLLHASYGTSTNPPPEQDFLPIPFFQIPNPNLVPEQTAGFDAGVEQPFLDGKWTVSGTYFQNNIRNLIDPAYDPVAFLTTPQNIARARTQGVEVGATWHPLPQLDVNASYTYLDAEDLSGTVAFNGVAVSPGSPLARRPRNTTAFAITGRPIQAVVLSVEGVWAAGLTEVDASEIPDWFSTRCTASWQASSHVQLFGRIENALNEKYQQAIGYPVPDQAFYGGFKLSY